MSLLGNGDSLPFSEAKNMELLLLKETKKPSVGNPHGKKASKGILSSLFKSAQVSGEILNPLVKTAYDSISDPVLVVLLASSHSILFANQAALTIFGLTADRIQGILVSAILPELNRERLHSLNSLSKRPSLIDASVAAAPEPYLEQDVLLMARCGGPQSGKTFTVSASFGRLAKEGLIKGSQVDPSDLLVVTLKKTILKASGSGTMLLMSRYRSEFEEVKTIGKGGFGIVVQAKNRLDGQEYAIKKVRLSCSPENVNIFNNAPSVTPKESKFFKGHKRHISESDHRLINEVKTFAQLSNHPNVIRYFNAWIEPVELDDSPKKSSVDDSASESSDSEDDEDDDETAFSVHKHRSTLFIQMQLCPYQDLRKWIVNRGPGVKLEASLGIFWQIVSGLVHIHTQGVVHRDVKPENIFVHQENVFLGDFGLAKNIQDHILSSSPQLSKAPLNEHVMSTEEGTYFYMAPETLASQTCTTKADIYSLGIILFELLTHFETAMERVVTLNALKEAGQLPQSLIDQYPLQCVLLAELISDDPHSRPSAQEILNHELFYEVSSRRGTASSFGGSGTESPLSNELDLFYSSLQTGFRRRSGETPGTRTDSASGHRLSLRNSKSVISLEFDQRRRRRTTADETYGAWAPFGFGDEPEPMRSGPHLTIDQHGQQDSITEGELLSIPDGFYQSPIAGQSRSVGMDNGPNNLISSSSHIPHSDFSRPTDVDATGLDSKDRIRSLERDVALLEAKLRAMTAHSLLLESELESRDIDAQSKSPGSPPSSVLCGFPIRLSSSPGQHRHSFPVGVPYGASPVSFQTSHSVAMSRNASGDSSHPITIPTPPSRPSRH